MITANPVERPAYISFEMRPVEKRDESLKRGIPVFEDVPFVFVTPQGSKDRMEFEAEEWFKQLKVDTENERFRWDWLQQYQAKYEAWKQGEETPVEGTSIKNWPGIGPSHVKMLIGMNIFTVEDLAAANEATLQRIGMGARMLKDKAAAYLGAASGVAGANDVAELKRKLTELGQTVDQLRMANSALAHVVQEVAPDKLPGKATTATTAPGTPL